MAPGKRPTTSGTVQNDYSSHRKRGQQGRPAPGHRRRQRAAEAKAGQQHAALWSAGPDIPPAVRNGVHHFRKVSRPMPLAGK
jgi:hypothetical protein